jgi:uncharacterized protein involved in exopolysaccharide biosynthesis
MPTSAAPGSFAEGEKPDDEIRLVELLAILMRRWRVLVFVPLVVALAAAGYSMIVRPVFTATTSFLPEQGSQSGVPSGLAGLAGQFGVSLSGGTQSPRLFAEFLKSETLSRQVLASRFRVPASTDSATLLDILEIKGGSTAERLDNGLKVLAPRVTPRAEMQTGVVRLSVDMPDRELAAGVANRMVDFLIAFNVQNRQSAARDRARFVEQRMAEAEQALRRSEGELRSFYERNRMYESSPQLRFEEGRLRREVDLHQGVYTTLSREYESSRIEQFNDVRSITVIDRASPPLIRSKPRRKELVLGSAVVALLGAAVWVFGAAWVETLRRRGGPEVDEIAARVREMTHLMRRRPRRI